jgi:hypothetical protein
MGFLDDIGGGGAKLLKFDGRDGSYKARGSDDTFNGQDLIADIYAARGGYLKFGGKGQPPERHLASVFPKDEAPSRSTLGNTDPSEWPAGRFGDEPEDPWTQVIEIPLRHKTTGEDFTFTASTRTSLAAAKNLLAQCRRLPEGCNPVVRLSTANAQGKFGIFKKPVLSIVGRAPLDEGGEPNDEIPW